MKKNKGFTLIELLVVIAIIGLLSGIVLVSMSGARNKGKDTRIISALEQVRNIATLIYDDSNSTSYAALCEGAADPAPNTLDETVANYGSDLDALETDIELQNGAVPVHVCYADADSYCVSSPLATSATTYKCVSSSGRMGSVTCASADDTTCQ